jgi:DNA-directed RNA polymerase specialized sigma24 family protein
LQNPRDLRVAHSIGRIFTFPSSPPDREELGSPASFLLSEGAWRSAAEVDETLAELETRDPLKAQIVLLRYFTGLTMDETAAILGLAEHTLDRHWRYLRAWLMKRLS